MERLKRRTLIVSFLDCILKAWEGRWWAGSRRREAAVAKLHLFASGFQATVTRLDINAAPSPSCPPAITRFFPGCNRGNLQSGSSSFHLSKKNFRYLYVWPVISL